MLADPIRRFKDYEPASEEELARNPQLLYHYTTREGLAGILGSGAVWGSHIRYLNDASEYNYARSKFVQKLREILRRIEHHREVKPWHLKELRIAISRLSKIKPDIFVFSLTTEGDLLSQWRAYGQPGNGYSIGFDAPSLDEIIRSKKGMYLAPVSYYAPEQLDLMNRIEIMAVQKAGPQPGDVRAFGIELRNIFLEVGPVMKHPAFEEESEWRIVVRQDDKTPQIRHRPGRSMLIPYVVVDLKPERRSFPIRHIIVGPHPHPRLEREAVEGLCRQCGLRVEITSSTIPYRAW